MRDLTDEQLDDPWLIPLDRSADRQCEHDDCADALLDAALATDWRDVQAEMSSDFDTPCASCQWLGVADAYLARAIGAAELARLSCEHGEPESWDCPATRCDACQCEYDAAKRAQREAETRAAVVRAAFEHVDCRCWDASANS